MKIGGEKRLKFWTRLKRAIRPILSGMQFFGMGRGAKPTNDVALVARYTSWVYTCAHKNAEKVAQTKLGLYIRGETGRFPTRALPVKQKNYFEKQAVSAVEEIHELTDHPLLDLLNYANPIQTGFEARELTALYQELLGNGYWFIEKDKALDVPIHFWPLMAQHVTIVADKNNFIKGYLYGNDPSNLQAFGADEVIHFPFPSPSNQLYGMGPLKACLAAVDRSRAQADYQQALWDNNARPDFAIVVAEGMNPKERKRLDDEWNAKHRGPKLSGRPVILEGGDVSIERFGWSPKDTGLIIAAKYDREEIAGAFGVPMTMLEVSKSRAEAEAGLYAYAEHTLMPRLRRMEQRLNEKLVPLFDPTRRLFVAFENPVPESVELEILKMEANARWGNLTRREMRHDQGRPPIEGDDELLIPAGMMPASLVGQQTTMGGVPPKSVRPFRNQTRAVDGTGKTVCVEAGEYIP